MKNSKISFHNLIDTKYDPETSIVLRYMNGFRSEMTGADDLEYKKWLQRTSIGEGTRVFPLLNYKEVQIYILDETSLMHTNTIKSIDGCVTIAKCKLKGYDTVVFESGGNTGMALTEYGQRVGIETFLFLPEENIPLLDSKTFESDKSHLVSVGEPGLVKKAVHVFSMLKGFKHVPETGWRYEASKFRGFFILEYMFDNGKFDWITQTISAAFGPIGIYSVLIGFGKEVGYVPKFLGIQQEANCPMHNAWKSKRTQTEPAGTNSTGHLLTRVMYDVNPHTYRTYEELKNVLISTDGDLTTISNSEFAGFLDYSFDGKSVLELLEDNGIEVTVKDGDVVEKSGLIALAGTLKEIDKATIPRGSKVLCCLTSGISKADGQSKPEFRIQSLDSMIEVMTKN